MKSSSRGFALVAALSTLTASATLGQTAPAGYLFDLQASHPGNLANYEFFSFTFVAAVSNTTVSFAFREVPAYFGFDDASVTTGGGPNLLADPGFESATDGQNVPTGWGRWIQPIDVSAIGQVASPSDPYGCENYGPYDGSEFWCDGSVEGYDAIYQTLPTTVGATYTVSWWMSDNSGQLPNDPEINVYGYATNGLPDGTIDVPPADVVPEPATLSLMGTGLAGVFAFARRRRRSA